VWPLHERLGQSTVTVTVQHRLLPRANVSRMYAECFDKVLYHVNSRILKCKMTNVITRTYILTQPIPYFRKENNPPHNRAHSSTPILIWSCSKPLIISPHSNIPNVILKN
jgi:hypothetical protein